MNVLDNPFTDAFEVLKSKKSIFLKNGLKRIFGESDCKRINRILELLDKLDIKLTFFVVGFLAEKHTSFIKEIHTRGHEIASHGFFHRSYAKMSAHEIRVDLERSKKVFAGLGIDICGFRPPYLSSNESLYDIAADLGFKYISGSVAFDFPIYQNKASSGLPYPRAGDRINEVPITAPTDFDLISYSGRTMKDAVEHWKNHCSADATYLFHPLFIGTRENLPLVKEFLLCLRDEHELVTMRKKAETSKGVALTMDIGLLSKMDLLRTFYIR